MTDIFNTVLKWAVSSDSISDKKKVLKKLINNHSIHLGRQH